MKSLFIIMLVLLTIAAPLYAQKPVVELPELQEWYSWRGEVKGSHISYLPNFDTANGGVNAITQQREGNPTWYNSFAYDTTNKFTWASSWVITRADLNGDGITDYIDAAGNIYKGVKKNSPPERIFDINYVGMSGGSYVADFNKDGKEDILTPYNQGAFSILFGGDDLKRLKNVTVNYPEFQYFSTGVSAYMNENNEARLLLYDNEKLSEGFYLFGITLEGTPNDSIIITLKELDRIHETKQTIDQRFIDGNCIGFYENKKTKEYTLLAPYYLPNIRTIPYAIINDKFVATKETKISIAGKFCLSGSIDGDDEPDWINVTYPDIVYSGNPAKDVTPRLQFPVNNKCYLNGSYTYIGDVTGDGIGDVALGKFGCFTIFKGIDWRKLSVTNETLKTDFTLHQTEPNPISSEGRAVLPATLAHTGKYTLEVYNLTGKRLGELFSGDLPIGEVRLPFDVKTLHLSGGMYTLRLSDGKNTQERAFIYHP